jgi:hypothetical protein
MWIKTSGCFQHVMNTEYDRLIYDIIMWIKNFHIDGLFFIAAAARLI